MQEAKERMEKSPPVSQFQEKVKEMAQVRPLRQVMEVQEEVPLSVYYAGLIGSIALSLSLFLSGRKWASLFVGLWAPMIISSALFYKLFRPSKRPTE